MVTLNQDDLNNVAYARKIGAFHHLPKLIEVNGEKIECYIPFDSEKAFQDYKNGLPVEKTPTWFAQCQDRAQFITVFSMICALVNNLERSGKTKLFLNELNRKS